MTSTDPVRRPARLDPWRTDFVLHLRLRDLGGGRIGDALAVVDAHCADSGEDPLQAFGDPEAYAAVVAEQTRPEDRAAAMPAWRAGLLGLAVMLGISLLLSGVAGLRGAGPALLTAGSLAAAALGATSIAVLVRLAPVLLVPRRGRRDARHVLSALAPVLMLATVLAVAALWRSTALRVDAGVALAVAAALLVAAGLSLRSVRPDPVVDPVSGADALPPTSRWLSLLSRWLLPGTLAVAVLVLLLLPPA